MAYRKLKKIKVSKSALDTLAAMFCCTTTKVYNALAFRSNSESAEMIRQEALRNYGGKEVIEIKVVEDYGGTGKVIARGC